MQTNRHTNTAPSGVRYNPPAGITPALARLIWRGEYDLKVFTCAVLTLAAKGWVTVADTPSGPELKPTGTGRALQQRESDLLRRLFSGRETLVLDGGAYIDLKAAQTEHFDALMEEDDAYVCSPLFANRYVNKIAGLFWPTEAKRTRRILKHAEGYRTYLDTAMRDRLDPVFEPGGQLSDICAAMPYVLAFDVENSWADEFAAIMATLLDDTVGTTSLYDLGDRALKRSRRHQRYISEAQKRNRETRPGRFR